MLKLPNESPGKRFKQLFKDDCLIIPGVFNAISARAAEISGAQAIYMTGAGVTNSLLGVPDIALINQIEMAQQARYICNITVLPVIADADTGYGEAIHLKRTIIEMESAGLAGIHIEDQMNPKRCGHLDGKSLIEPKTMAQKIKASCESRKDPDFLIIARTDARGPEGLEKAIERAKLYQDYGADIIFPEGLESEKEFIAFRKNIKIPLLANMTEFGKTPLINVSRYKEIGYEMVIFPMAAFRVMLKSVCDTYQEILKTGSQANLIGKMKTRQELYNIIEYDLYNLLDQNWSQQ